MSDDARVAIITSATAQIGLQDIEIAFAKCTVVTVSGPPQSGPTVPSAISLLLIESHFLLSRATTTATLIPSPV